MTRLRLLLTWSTLMLVLSGMVWISPAEADTQLAVDPYLVTQYRDLIADSNGATAATAQSNFDSSVSDEPVISNYGSSSDPTFINPGSGAFAGFGVYYGLVPAVIDQSATSLAQLSTAEADAATTQANVSSASGTTWIQAFVNGNPEHVYAPDTTATGNFAISQVLTNDHATPSADNQCLDKSSGTNLAWGACGASTQFFHLVPSTLNDGSYQIEETPDLYGTLTSNTCLIQKILWGPSSEDPQVLTETGTSFDTQTCRGADSQGDSYYSEGGGQSQAQSYFLPGWKQLQTGDSTTPQVSAAPLPAFSFTSASSVPNSVNVCNWSGTTIDYYLTYTYSDFEGNGYYLADGKPDLSGSFPVGQCNSISLPDGYLEGALVVEESGASGLASNEYYFNGAGVNFTSEVYGNSFSGIYQNYHTKSDSEGSIGTVDTDAAIKTSGSDSFSSAPDAFADYLYLEYVASNPNIANALQPGGALAPGTPSWSAQEAKFMSAKIFGCADTTCSNPFANRGVPSITDAMKSYVNLSAPLFDTATNKAASAAMNEIGAAAKTGAELEGLEFMF